jgi:hypothetical protein
VVIAREDTPGDKRLVAYVLASSNEAAPEEELRKFVREALPEYMVPSACVRLDGFPLTPNGKLDRKALPAPSVGLQSKSSTAAPTSAVEVVIATVWRQLGVAADDIDRSFFDLGGHSLLAARVTARLLDVFQLDVPLRTFFLAPTIAGLSDAIVGLGASRGVDAKRIAQLFLSVSAMSDTDARNALMHLDGAQPV